MSAGPSGRLPPPLTTPFPRGAVGPRVELRSHEATVGADALTALVTRNLAHLSMLAFADREPIDDGERRSLIVEWEASRAAGRDATYGIWVDGRLIGSCGLHRRQPDPASVEIGYWIDESHQGNGYALEAVLLLVEVAFSNEEIHVALICFDVNNQRSGRVATAAGFTWFGEVDTPPSLLAAAASGREVVTRLRREDVDPHWRSRFS